jgi:hypothetical protein
MPSLKHPRYEYLVREKSGLNDKNYLSYEHLSVMLWSKETFTFSNT